MNPNDPKNKGIWPAHIRTKVQAATLHRTIIVFRLPL